MKWQVEIVRGGPYPEGGERYPQLQGGPLPEMNGEVHLERGPFTIRVKLPKPMTVQLNVLGDDRNFRLIQPGLSIENVATDAAHCFSSLGTGLAEYPHALVSRASLCLMEKGHHELYYTNEKDHRWNRVSVSDRETVFERYVCAVEIPLDEFWPLNGNHLYLIFLVKHHAAEKVIYPDELKKLVLTFV